MVAPEPPMKEVKVLLKDGDYFTGELSTNWSNDTTIYLVCGEDAIVINRSCIKCVYIYGAHAEG